MNYLKQHLREHIEIAKNMDLKKILLFVNFLYELRKKSGRLFILGVGGSAANASHAVNDFRKLAGIESYSPSDNISELTARTNDEGWDTTYSAWLKVSKLNSKDMLFVFSVGGGNLEKNISPNIVRAVSLAKEVGAKVIGVLGRDGGYTASVADACVVIPTVNNDMVTPHTESFQALVWHLLVSDPRLQMMLNKWESSVK
jgi:D-sedoheptulose 7-phosphate isomerase